MVSMQAFHYSQHIAYFEFLKADWAFLALIKDIVCITPLHSRQIIDLCS